MTSQLPIALIDRLDNISIFQTAAITDADFGGDLSATVDSGAHDLGANDSDANSEASYGDFNLGLHVNDHPKSVLNNRSQLLAAINQSLSEHNKPPIERLCWLNQVHGNQVFQVKKSHLGMTPPDCDAQISDLAGVGLAIMTADCVPIVLYQPASNKIAAIHAGWQGLACGVIKQTIEQLDDAPIIAWIGVAIRQDNYEVGKEVLATLKSACQHEHLLSDNHLADFDDRYGKPSNSNKVLIDLPKLALDQLTAKGVHVQSAATDCSYGDSRFYSYRRQSHQNQPATGRMALVIVRHE